ncbi:hypothetical protein [Vulcanisaeta distributa]|uniref:hypothetical protein n=1 Tax=Vulcanisaeta distributa TaxID=164451 RepID=UPI001FB55D9D|nr:hypothetical protein [Vulcanisaeta distributa]
MSHGLGTTAMLNMGIIAVSLGMLLMLTWSSAARECDNGYGIGINSHGGAPGTPKQGAGGMLGTSSRS